MKRYWVGFIVLAFLLSACSVIVDVAPGGDGTPSASGQAEPSVEAAPEEPGGAFDDVKPPLATLTVNGAAQTAGLGTYCWSDDTQGVGICLDAIGIPTPQEALVAPSPFTAQFEIPVEQAPRDVVLTVRPANSQTEMSEQNAQGWRWWAYVEGENYQLPLVREPRLDLDLAPGLYVLDLFVSWETLGDASYGFLVKVE
jgi:hypothetical protein